MLHRSTIPGAQGFEPSEETRAAVLALIRQVGEATAGERLAVDRLVLARAAAGLPLREGTLLRLTQRLAAGTPTDTRQLTLLAA